MTGVPRIPRRLGRLALILSVTGGVVASSLATVTRAASSNDASTLKYEQDIRPLLDTACFHCHGPSKKKGKVDFSTFADDRSAGRDRKLWRRSIEQIETGEMPPEGEKPLSPEDREKLLKWMKRTAEAIDPNDPAARDPGPGPARRLNRAEYNATVRDLVGIDFDAGQAVGMPDDTPVHGFANLANHLTLPPALMDKYFAGADKILEELFNEPDPDEIKKLDGTKKKRLEQARKARATIVFVQPGDALPKREAAKQIIERFAKRAYRRPLTRVELDRVVKLFDVADGKGDTFENGLRLALKGVLVSPHFLFRAEGDRPATAPAGEKVYRVSDWELATRLSYFLWSTMPDEALFALAEQGKLSDPAALEQQVRRMLADPKAKAMTENFAVQWFQLNLLADARPSTEAFPTFNSKVKKAMADETTMFFDKLREEDRSVLELLDCDYTYLNEDLAKHYGIDGVKGSEIRRVQLKPEHNRGGLLGMGSVLAMTSHTSRTSPTLRGKYVLEVIFGTPPPPPPPDVSVLNAKPKKGEPPKSFREQMAQHAADASCATCHKRIDPLGYGLENFNAVGQWRTDAGGGLPLDATGQLPTGERFNGAGELKKVILAKQDQFKRNVVEQMLTYALGRELGHYDELTIREVMAAMEKGDHRFSALVNAVVKSLPFQYRKDADE